MAITRPDVVELADAWADDEEGVTLRLVSRRVQLTVAEAERFAGEVLDAARLAREAITERREGVRTLGEFLTRQAGAERLGFDVDVVPARMSCGCVEGGHEAGKEQL